MKNLLLCCFTACLLFPLASVKGQNNPQTASVQEVTVAPSLLKFATLMGFKYTEVLDKAKKGDLNSLKSLLEFHGTTDGTDALNHAQTCLELIPVATDGSCASAIQNLKPKLKILLLDRFALAQGRTKNTELQKPIKDWAPETWASLNNLPYVCNTCEESKKMSKEYVKNPDGTLSKINPLAPGEEATLTDGKKLPAVKPGTETGTDANTTPSTAPADVVDPENPYPLLGPRPKKTGGNN